LIIQQGVILESYKDYLPSNARVLHLTVTREWFDKIKSGEKGEDFREFKAHWITRLLQTDIGEPIPTDDAKGFALDWSSFAIMHMIGGISRKEYDYVIVVNGYGGDKPTLICKWCGTRITDYDEKTDLGIGRFFAVKVDVLKVINDEAAA